MKRTNHLCYTTLLVTAVLLTGVLGCGYKWGSFLYHMGFAPKQKIDAEYKLPQGSVLILMDDDLDLIRPPLARQDLVEKLAMELKKNEITDRVTTNEEIAKIRQSNPDFEKTAADQVGRLANADTVIWIKTKKFFINKDLEMNVSPGKFTVEVRVLNALADTREDVRLWPKNQLDGRIINVTVGPHDLRECQTLAQAHGKIASEMADKIAKLFYDYQIDPYEE